MGRETEATVTWQGDTGLSRMLLESTEIILRGEIRGRIPRTADLAAHCDGDDLILNTQVGRLVATMGATESAAWAKALQRPPPDLAARLGVSPSSPVFVAASGDAPMADSLAEAFVDAMAASADMAAQILAIIHTEADLRSAQALASRFPEKPVWCVYPKGKGDGPRDSGIRTAFRAMDWIDTKSSAVSDTLTATRYNRRKIKS